MAREKNPFIQDPERQITSVPRPWFKKHWFATILIASVGLLVLLYVLANLNAPHESGHEDPYDVSRPIRRFNDEESFSDEDPYDVSRPIRRRPATLEPDEFLQSVTTSGTDLPLSNMGS